jgi:hypothetical protein
MWSIFANKKQGGRLSGDTQQPHGYQSQNDTQENASTNTYHHVRPSTQLRHKPVH